MRVLLPVHGARGDVEPVVGFALRLPALGAEVQARAASDFADATSDRS
ncbi:hypothetical protein ACWCP6_31490 [Streptomyces sp. NPDC002004]